VLFKLWECLGLFQKLSLRGRAETVFLSTFWNSLADELRTYSSDRFKLALKTYLFATY